MQGVGEVEASGTVQFFSTGEFFFSFLLAREIVIDGA